MKEREGGFRLITECGGRSAQLERKSLVKKLNTGGESCSVTVGKVISVGEASFWKVLEDRRDGQGELQEKLGCTF